MKRTLLVAATVVAIAYAWRRGRRWHARITAATLALTSLYVALRVR